VADAVWPPSLDHRALQLRTLQGSASDVVVRTAMDVGPPKVRRRITAGVQPWDGELKLTRAELLVFKEFFDDTLAGGALSFEWVDPMTGDAADFLFAEPPRWNPLAPRQVAGTEYWTVGLRLLQLPPAPAEAAVPPGPDEEIVMMTGWFDYPGQPEPPAGGEAAAEEPNILAFDTTVAGDIPLEMLAPYQGSDFAGEVDDFGEYSPVPIPGSGSDDPGTGPTNPEAPNPDVPIEGGGGGIT
jgi:hypothetical protein